MKINSQNRDDTLFRKSLNISFKCIFFRTEFRIRHIIPVPVQIFPFKIKSCHTPGNPILVSHWHDMQAECSQPFRVIPAYEFIDQTFCYPVSSGFPRMSSGPYYYMIRCIQVSKLNYLKRSLLNRLTDIINTYKAAYTDAVFHVFEV